MFAFLLTLTLGGQAHAQTPEKIVAVVDNAKYAMAPYGIRTGSFIISPGLSLGESYDDNVYRDQTNTKSDFITMVAPVFAVASDFNLHSLFFGAGGEFGYYRDNKNENYQDYNLTAGGRLDLDYETFASLSSSFRKTHEARESANNPNSDKPIEYSLTTHTAGFTRALGIIQLYLEGVYDSFKFQDYTRNGLRVDNSGRDYDVYTANTRIAYEYFPDYNFYVSSRLDWRRYKNTVGISRDSQGVELRVGTDLYITGKIKADVYAGYLDREYEGGTPGINSMNYGGSVTWNATGLTSITASVSRGIEETTFATASGNLETRFLFQVDHLLAHNLFLSANTNLTLSDYEATLAAAKREDESYGAGVSVEYMPSNGTSVKLGYSYSERDSNIAGERYDNNRVMLNLSKKF